MILLGFLLLFLGAYTYIPALIFVIVIMGLGLILFIWSCLSQKDEIRIDKDGISCVKEEKIEWAYTWSEIQRLRKITLYGNPGVLIVPTNEAQAKIAPQDQVSLTFQLCPIARKALKQYSPYPLTKI